MFIAFTLSMPGVASWNGQWTGSGKKYVRVLTIHKAAEEIVQGSPYRYDFGDGWAASVFAVEVDAKDARRLRRQTDGFCGYDWMIDSIRVKGKIEASA